MELQLETPVFSADGTDMGKVHRVIFDPQKAEVKNIVVEKGVFFARDVAIPIEDVRAATTSRVELSL
ncbi:MAG: PRC-barrel domain-containing protein, partial [Chloroflexota bacterium]